MELTIIKILIISSMHSIETLSQLISRFPGIGPRQAKRIVYSLLTQDDIYLSSLSDEIRDLKKHIKQCVECYAYFYSNDPAEMTHPIMRDSSRDIKTLMVVEKDSDLETMEKSHLYNGLYFVLGGSLPVVEKDPQKKIRLRELESFVLKYNPTEIIIAMNATPEGDNTADFLKEKLEGKATLSILGRGLSTGTEIEYSDKETLDNALRNRK